MSYNLEIALLFASHLFPIWQYELVRGTGQIGDWFSLGEHDLEVLQTGTLLGSGVVHGNDVTVFYKVVIELKRVNFDFRLDLHLHYVVFQLFN